MTDRSTSNQPSTPYALRTAKLLLEIGAIGFSADKPFIFTSGWASPVYVDCRRVIAFPRTRRAIIAMAKELLLDTAGAEQFDAVAGGETAGIPYAAWLADALDLPMLYVRKQAKGFGRNAQIEGQFKDGDRVLLVEDLATDGKSKAKFIEALRAAGAKVAHSFVVFHYGIFPQSLATMEKHGVQLHALTTWWDALTVARQSGSFSAATLNTIEEFLRAPAAWSAAHGGATGTDG